MNPPIITLLTLNNAETLLGVDFWTVKTEEGTVIAISA